MDIAHRNLMRSALETMRQFCKAMKPGAIDSLGSYSFPQINVPVPAPRLRRDRQHTQALQTIRRCLQPHLKFCWFGARLEAAKALYKQEKERYREERERKREERMGRIAR